MAKIGSIHKMNVQQDVRELEREVGSDCHVWSGELQVHGFPRSGDFETLGDVYYLRADFQVGKSRESFALLVSPYDLLVFAQQILDELNPVK